MKKMLATAFLATVAFLGFAQVSDARGCFRSCRGGCEAPCAPATPVEVKYEERKIKVAKTVWKDKEVEVLECRRVMKDEVYKYIVCEPVYSEEKRKDRK